MKIYGYMPWFMIKFNQLEFIMKQFLETNTITYNLMSFSAFKSMLIFTALIESPKSYEELKEIFDQNEYITEIPSIDTIRIYINSLKEFGCNVIRTNDKGVIKFFIDSHPFILNFDKKQVKSLLKIYKAVSKSIEIEDLRFLQRFFKKLSTYVADEEQKIKLQNLSPFNNIDEKLVDNLITYIQNGTEIVLLYNSPTSGHKNITIIPDKLKITGSKLYISGFNSEYKYSTLLVNKIIKIISVNIQNKTMDAPEITVGYRYKRDLEEIFEILENEKLIKSEYNTDFIEITSRNKFEIMQRVFSLGAKCTVLYPEDVRKSVIYKLKKMKEEYLEK